MSVDNWAELVAEEENIVSKMCFAMAGLQSFEWEQAPFFVAPVPLFQSRFPAAVSYVRIALAYLVCPVYLADLVYQVGLADPGGPSAQLDPVVDLHGDPSVDQLGDLLADRVADPHADLPFGPTVGLHGDPFGDLGAGLLADRRSHYGHRPDRYGHYYRRHGLIRCWPILARCSQNPAHCCRFRHGRYDCRLDSRHGRWPLRGAIGRTAHSELVLWSAPRRGLSTQPARSRAKPLWIFVS